MALQIFRARSLLWFFAGKVHAILQRSWEYRVKGRDYFDFVWYIARGVPCHLSHLEHRLRQSGGWLEDSPLGPEDLVKRLSTRFEDLDVEAARKDVLPFLKDVDQVALWSKEFFQSLLPRLTLT
ncbi:MAG: nucleotidyl transferase AbiEii/AbiGii toxin family protein [Vulcanimicrobiota bacterium]